MKNALSKSLFCLGCTAAASLNSHAALVFTAGTTVAAQTQPNVNNLIDLELSDFSNNSTTALTGYTATSGQSITGSMTRSNLTVGSLISSTQMNTLISGAQAANELSGVVNFTTGTGTVTGNAFEGTNSTGTQVFTSNITLAGSQFVSRSFSGANSVGTGATNSAPVNGGGYLNLNSTTWTLATPVDAFGFTQLQRDGSRTYSWSVRIVDLTTLATQTISLGGITTAGTPIGMTSGDADAINYGYDTFVGYQAPSGFAIDQVTMSGGFMNVDSFAYSMIPEPSSSLTLLGSLGFLLVLRRRA